MTASTGHRLWRPELEHWQYRPDCLIHTPHSVATQSLLERMVDTFFENSDDRDLLIDLGVTELVVRMLRHQTRAVLLSYCKSAPDAHWSYRRAA